MDREAILKNAALWRERIGEASARWGGAKICAVTKTRDAQTVNCLSGSGIDILGENRVQELLDKREALEPEFHLHLIGGLQTNKVRYIAPWIEMVQSLDRDALAEELSRRAIAADRVIPALVQVNIGREPQKGGVYEEELEAFVRRCAALPGLHVSGLMAIMPLTDEPEALRPLFRVPHRSEFRASPRRVAARKAALRARARLPARGPAGGLRRRHGLQQPAQRVRDQPLLAVGAVVRHDEIAVGDGLELVL